MDTNTNLNDVNRIASGTVFKGQIISANDIRIDGHFEGRLESKKRLVVGEHAVVNGDIISNNVDFSGRMSSGTLYVEDTLSLKSGCTVNGDVRFKSLQVELGAVINGTCQVIGDKDTKPLSPATPAKKTEKQNDHGNVEE
ncbi:MAG: polymer-forming cytoskeletal protein [Bacteroidales bacterium]|nr:polymer-forming cytoskeletal protein [Bacteroidales bacterium]